MAKKPKVVNPDKEFLNKCNLIFSSLSCRSTQHAFFNIQEDLILLANATIPNPEPEFGSRIMNFSVGDLSLHFVYIKDRAFMNRLRSLLRIPDGAYYCIHTGNFLTSLKSAPLEELNVFQNGFGDTVMVKRSRSTYDKKNIVGMPIRDFHIASELAKWKKYVETINTKEFNDQHPHYLGMMNKEVDINGRQFTIDIDTVSFENTFGNKVFSNSVSKLKLFCMDGLTSVSIREFIKRMLNKTFRFDLYAYVANNTHIRLMVEYEDDTVLVRSVRPNVLCIPMPSASMSGSAFSLVPKEN